MEHMNSDVFVTGDASAFRLHSRRGRLYGVGALDLATGHITGDRVFQSWYGALTPAQRRAARVQMMRQLAPAVPA